MTRHAHAALPLSAALLSAVALTGCNSGTHDVQHDFEFTGGHLTVHNATPMRVRTAEGGTRGRVHVVLHSTTLGKDASDPGWALRGDTLDLGAPCGGYVGVCEGTYTVTVPAGTTVNVGS